MTQVLLFLFFFLLSILCDWSSRILVDLFIGITTVTAATTGPEQRTYEVEALLFRLRSLTESKRREEGGDSDSEMIVTNDHFDITNAATASSQPSSPPFATTLTGVASSSLVTSSVHDETSKRFSPESSIEFTSPTTKKQVYVVLANHETNRR